MYNGMISNNNCGVKNAGDFNMYGGTISENINKKPVITAEEYTLMHNIPLICMVEQSLEILLDMAEVSIIKVHSICTMAAQSLIIQNALYLEPSLMVAELCIMQVHST